VFQPSLTTNRIVLITDQRDRILGTEKTLNSLAKGILPPFILSVATHRVLFYMASSNSVYLEMGKKLKPLLVQQSGLASKKDHSKISLILSLGTAPRYQMWVKEVLQVYLLQRKEMYGMPHPVNDEIYEKNK